MENKARKLKIVSDGTRKGTSIIDVESGEPIAYVMKIEIIIDANDPVNRGIPQARITVLLPEMDIIANGEVLPFNPT